MDVTLSSWMMNQQSMSVNASLFVRMSSSVSKYSIRVGSFGVNPKTGDSTPIVHLFDWLPVKVSYLPKHITLVFVSFTTTWLLWQNFCRPFNNFFGPCWVSENKLLLSLKCCKYFFLFQKACTSCHIFHMQVKTNSKSLAFRRQSIMNLEN